MKTAKKVVVEKTTNNVVKEQKKEEKRSRHCLMIWREDTKQANCPLGFTSGVLSSLRVVLSVELLPFFVSS